MNHPAVSPRIAILGIGRMGLPMATRLCQAGLTVHAWNRNHAKAEPLAALGARVHPLSTDAVREADIVISLLENGPVVEQVLFGLGTVQAMQPGTLVVDMASIKPAEARDHAARLQAMGLRHVDAPVSGGTVAAEAGTLAIMAGGEAADLAHALPVLQHLGTTTHVGPHGAGQLAKLANQMIVGITIGAVSEALLMCAKGGADMAKVREACATHWTPPPAWAFRHRSPNCSSACTAKPLTMAWPIWTIRACLSSSPAATAWLKS